MSNIAIVTDSTAYLTEEEVKRDAVTVVPLTVNFEDGAMEDGLIDARAFFERVDASTKIPFTSQPSAGQFLEVYEKLLAQGKEIISIHISSKLSGTLESAGKPRGCWMRITFPFRYEDRFSVIMQIEAASE